MKQARPFFISAVITAFIMVTLSFFIEDAADSRGTLCAGLIAAMAIAAIPIYDISGWSLLKRSVAHFLAMLVTVFPLMLLAGWYNVPISFVVFLGFGVVGWTVGYVFHRIQEKKSRADDA